VNFDRIGSLRNFLKKRMPEKNNPIITAIEGTLKSIHIDPAVPNDTTQRNVNQPFFVPEPLRAGQPSVLWLQCNVKRTCWYFKALYEYEAYVTTGQDPSSPRFAVDEITLSINRPIDAAFYTHTCRNTDYCAKSDDFSSTGGACGRTCLTASAVFQGTRWATTPACIE
jgi:hypothetical protein